MDIADAVNQINPTNGLPIYSSVSNALHDIIPDNISNIKPAIPMRKAKGKKSITYKLGKHKNGTISVLIKNAPTRKRIRDEFSQLKHTPILNIRKYLKNKNLLKSGSNAPNDILRQTYEQSILAGQIENRDKNTMLHNYLSKEDDV